MEALLHDGVEGETFWWVMEKGTGRRTIICARASGVEAFGENGWMTEAFARSRFEILEKIELPKAVRRQG